MGVPHSQPRDFTKIRQQADSTLARLLHSSHLQPSAGAREHRSIEKRRCHKTSIRKAGRPQRSAPNASAKPRKVTGHNNQNRQLASIRLIKLRAGYLSSPAGPMPTCHPVCCQSKYIKASSDSNTQMVGVAHVWAEYKTARKKHSRSGTTWN